MNKTMGSVAAITLAMSLSAYAQTSSVTTPNSPASKPTPDVVSPVNKNIARPDAMANDKTGGMATDRRAMKHDRSQEKDQLEKALSAGQSRGDYRKIIEKDGYKISSINEDKPDYLEYEIVKGEHSYEVHLDFKNKSAKATDIDVTNNLWRAESTKKMEKDNSYTPTALAAEPGNKYSDRGHLKSSNDEKAKLKKALKPGHSVAQYKKEIEGMGYKITSVNDKTKDYVEYEVVKGNNSYEVQIDLDNKQMGKDIDVDANVWEAASTEKAKGEK